VVLRGRAHGGNPGVHLATPLRVPAGGTVVMVNRGWAPSPDGARVDAARYAEPGAVVVEGVLQAVPRTADGGAPSTAGAGAEAVTTHRRLDLAALRRDRPELLPLYVQQLPAADSARAPLKRVPPPPLTDGSHLGYAVQWFSFAAIAVVGLAILLLRGRRR
jgi:surfeit locus 1 family protein